MDGRQGDKGGKWKGSGKPKASNPRSFQLVFHESPSLARLCLACGLGLLQAAVVKEAAGAAPTERSWAAAGEQVCGKGKARASGVVGKWGSKRGKWEGSMKPKDSSPQSPQVVPYPISNQARPDLTYELGCNQAGMVLRAARVGPHRQFPGCCGGADWQESKSESQEAVGKQGSKWEKAERQRKAKNSGP